jgi:hypothetical protein
MESENGLGFVVWTSTAYHFLDLEFDILQAPFEVRHLDGHDAVVRWNLDRPGLRHRRGEVDDEHSGCVLKKSVTGAGFLRGWMVTPARSAGISDDVAPENPIHAACRAAGWWGWTGMANTITVF